MQESAPAPLEDRGGLRVASARPRLSAARRAALRVQDVLARRVSIVGTWLMLRGPVIGDPTVVIHDPTEPPMPVSANLEAFNQIVSPRLQHEIEKIILLEDADKPEAAQRVRDRLPFID